MLITFHFSLLIQLQTFLLHPSSWSTFPGHASRLRSKHPAYIMAIKLSASIWWLSTPFICTSNHWPILGSLRRSLDQLWKCILSYTLCSFFYSKASTFADLCNYYIINTLITSHLLYVSEFHPKLSYQFHMVSKCQCVISYSLNSKHWTM